MMRRWVHKRLNRHRWKRIAHNHNVAITDAMGESATADCYSLEECSCGAIREHVVTSSSIATILPGLTLGAVMVETKNLDRLEDARVWSGS